MVDYFDLCYFHLLFITFCVNLYLTQYVLDIFFGKEAQRNEGGRNSGDEGCKQEDREAV